MLKNGERNKNGKKLTDVAELRELTKGNLDEVFNSKTNFLLDFYALRLLRVARHEKLVADHKNCYLQVINSVACQALFLFRV